MLWGSQTVFPRYSISLFTRSISIWTLRVQWLVHVRDPGELHVMQLKKLALVFHFLKAGHSYILVYV